MFFVSLPETGLSVSPPCSPHRRLEEFSESQHSRSTRISAELGAELQIITYEGMFGTVPEALHQPCPGSISAALLARG